jgi:hypothetical protein
MMPGLVIIDGWNECKNGTCHEEFITHQIKRNKGKNAQNILSCERIHVFLSHFYFSLLLLPYPRPAYLHHKQGLHQGKNWVSS